MIETVKQIFAFIFLILVALMFVWVSGCASKQARLDMLRYQNPDCEVLDDFYMICPPPYEPDRD